MAGEENFRTALGWFGLDPGAGYDTAAAGARAAQTDANALSNLQWQRQMAGLQEAQGYTNQLQSLYNQLYSPGGGAPAAGGLSSLGQPAGGYGGGASSMLIGPPTKPEEKAPSKLEQEFPSYVPGASFGYLNDGQYSKALHAALPTPFKAAWDAGKSLF